MRSRLTTPGSTQATRLSTSTSRMRFIRVSATTIGAPSGMAPPARPVPAPRGTTARPWARAMRMIACTSAVDSGKHTGPATPPPNTEASRLSSDRSAPSTSDLVVADRRPQLGRQRVRSRRRACRTGADAVTAPG